MRILAVMSNMGNSKIWGNTTVGIHVIYWILFTLFFTMVWGTYDGNFYRNFMVQLCSLPSRLLLVYATLFVLLPRFFKKEKYTRFIFWLVLLCIIVTLLQRTVMLYLVEPSSMLDYQSSRFFVITQLMNTFMDVAVAAVIPFGYTLFNFFDASKRKSEELMLKNKELLNNAVETYIHLKEGKALRKLVLKDIVFIESLKSYVRIKTVSDEIISHNSISSMQNLLPDHKFLRLHRSFIINIDYISTFSPAQVDLNGIVIPIGRKYKEAVKKKLGYY